MRSFSLLVLVIGLLGCPPEPVIPPPNPPVDTDLCGAMCAHLKSLGCEEGQDVYNSDMPGPTGVPNQTCQTWCEELQDASHLFFVNPRCVATVTSCDQIEEYRKKEPALCK
jgi:hypothetical protein